MVATASLKPCEILPRISISGHWLGKRSMSKPLERFAGMSVLIVDDNPSNVALLQALLDEQGLFRIYTETDPRQVPRQLAQNDPDLVLLDLHMPGVDGHEVLTQIKLYAAGSFLPVLVLTADTTTTARDRALSEGAQDFLTKPIDGAETALRIANLLRTRQLFTTLRQARLHSAHGDEAEEGAAARRPGSGSCPSFARAPSPRLPAGDRRPHADPGRLRGPLPLPGHRARGAGSLVRRCVRRRPGRRAGMARRRKVLNLLQACPMSEPEPFLAVNMSPASVLHLLTHQLCEPELYPRIVVELTEHVPIEDYAAVHESMAAMRERRQPARRRRSRLGLRRFPPSDPAAARHHQARHLLVRGIHRSKGQRALASALVAFAADVGARVIAEGVEESGELETLQDIGVPWAQGYFLGQACPAARQSGEPHRRRLSPRAGRRAGTPMLTGRRPHPTVSWGLPAFAPNAEGLMSAADLPILNSCELTWLL